MLAAALWSLNGPLIKVLDQQGVSPWTIACYRSLIGGLCFAPWAWGRRKTLRTIAPGWPVAAVAAFTTLTICFVLATSATSAANAIVLQYTSSIWVFALAPLVLGERPDGKTGAVLLVAVIGIGVLFFGNLSQGFGGLGLALISGFAFGVLTLILRRMRSVDPILVVTLNAVGSGMLLVVPLALRGELGLTLPQGGLLLFMGVVQFTLPYAMFSWGLRSVEAPRAALISLLECVLNPIWTYFAVAEIPSVATLAGGALILISVAVAATMRPARDAPTIGDV